MKIKELLKPLRNDTSSYQSYLCTGLHTLGLLGWILEQTGRADVYVSTFSTSDAFLSGFLRLKKKHLINHSVLVADLKASRKTVGLYRLMSACFDNVYLAMNHSKIVLVQNDHWTVSVITSQNQTYGDRAECTLITTDQETFLSLYSGLSNLVNNQSYQLDGLFNRLDESNRRVRQKTDDAQGNSSISSIGRDGIV